MARVHRFFIFFILHIIFILIVLTYHGGGLLFGEGAMMRGNRFTNHTSGVHDGRLGFFELCK